MDKERAIQIFQEAGGLLEGHFLLTSGKHSNKYLQCARVLEYPKYTIELAEEIANSFKGDNIDIVIGPAMGGMIIAYEVARQLNTRNMFAERENGVMSLRRSFTIPKGSRVLVVEDVITTGGSVQEVINIVKENEGILVGVAVLVDRTNGKINFGTKLVSCLSIEVEAFDKENCPICKTEIPLTKPGSREIKQNTKA